MMEWRRGKWVLWAIGAFGAAVWIASGWHPWVAVAVLAIAVIVAWLMPDPR
jgi:hypothetical protein